MTSRDAADVSESVAWHAANTAESAAEAVVTVVAEATGRSPLELDPLYEVVDPDALNMLLDDGPPSVSVTFDYCGQTVTITGERIEVDPATSVGT